MSTTAARFQFTDVLGAPLNDDSVVVDALSLDNSVHFRALVPLNGQTEVAINLQGAASGVYRFQMAPTNYRFLQFFFRLNEGETSVRDKPVVFPVDPARVSGISAPAFAALDESLRNFLAATKLKIGASKPASGAALYASLPDIRKAALLNLFSKASRTRLPDGANCFDLGPMVELDQDRLFAKTGASLLEETMQAPGFRPVSFALHKEIPPYRLLASFKTRDTHGNLQLTFSRNGQTGADYLVDMDIDEGQGIEHIFEVIRNSISGLTNPYDIREILAASQNIEPLYSFIFASHGIAEPVTAIGAG